MKEKTMKEDSEHKLEAATYRMAKRKGFRLQKCRSRQPVPDYGTYRLVNPYHNSVVLNGPGNYGLTLDEVSEYLREAKPLEWTALIPKS